MVYPGELAVAAELGANLVTIVMNNRGYLQVGDRLERYFGTRHGCGLPEVDFVKMAESMGVLARRAEDPASLADVVDWALAQTRPALIDVTITGDNLLDMTLPQTRVLQDKLFKRDPLRPPWPFPSE
jgi:thiamine pyrophosphate-dependent acetolactate synthase large subunit-like protein